MTLIEPRKRAVIEKMVATFMGYSCVDFSVNEFACVHYYLSGIKGLWSGSKTWPMKF